MTNQNFYTKLRSIVIDWAESKNGKTSKWMEYVLLAPDFFYLLYKLMLEPQIKPIEKIKLVSAISYFILPIDLMPEAFLGPIGFLDDITFAAFALNSIINNYSSALIRKYWLGEIDILVTIKNVISMAHHFLGSYIYGALRRKYNNPSEVPFR
ncbi:MAG: DUF1232 domain-containing protein [Melioribacteraceae bacterium]|nr:DUF1232 domain-containing protein [Melioribacteraceae bacterium]